MRYIVIAITAFLLHFGIEYLSTGTLQHTSAWDWPCFWSNFFATIYVLVVYIIMFKAALNHAFQKLFQYVRSQVGDSEED